MLEGSHDGEELCSPVGAANVIADGTLERALHGSLAGEEHRLLDEPEDDTAEGELDGSLEVSVGGD